MPRVIPLAEPEARRERDRRLRERMPDLAKWLADQGRMSRDPDELLGHVRGTRWAARRFVAEHPEVTGSVTLDCTWVEAASPPFIHELLKAWPEATFINCNEDVEQTVEWVRQRSASEPS